MGEGGGIFAPQEVQLQLRRHPIARAKSQQSDLDHLLSREFDSATALAPSCLPIARTDDRSVRLSVGR